MANTRAATLRDLSDEAVVERLAETKAELFNLRFQHVTGQLDNTARLGELRKEVARVNTELRSREIAAAEALGQGPPARQIAQETTR
ncbi:MAG: 50S ribosomal protein L29 [Acidimicrobiales bacterium]